MKFECLRLLATLKLDPARMRMISYFVDSYLRLSREETKRFESVIAGTIIAPRQKETIMEMVTSWMEEGIEKGLLQGRQEGRQEGLLEGRRETVLDVLRDRFGSLPDSVVRRIAEIGSVEELRSLSSKALHIQSLDELGWKASGENKDSR